MRPAHSQARRLQWQAQLIIVFDRWGCRLLRPWRYALFEFAAFLGLANRLGRLAPGYQADMVAFEPGRGIRIVGTWLLMHVEGSLESTTISS